jgi:peptide deformylase
MTTGAEWIKRWRGGYQQILLWPHKLLALKAAPVAEVDASVRALLDDLTFTMLFTGGGGLSAAQIGDLRRVFVLKVMKAEAERQGVTSEIVHVVNPELVMASQETSEALEGCLSLPGQRVLVTRPKVARIKALGYDGQPFELGGDGLLAMAILHELDHLNGVTIGEHATPLKRDLMRRKLRNAGVRYKTVKEFEDSRREQLERGSLPATQPTKGA